ncbi:MAG TPA: hypothetical protein VHG91_14020 [Longimicrobium sp.]|nr:hypothetical protein [Longimicrobium sp.]
MSASRLSMNLEALNVESFLTDPSAPGSAEANYRIYYTVLYETEQVSCGGTCGSCTCMA